MTIDSALSARALLLTVCCILVSGSLVEQLTSASAAPTLPVTYHVSTMGSDANSGTIAQPFRTIQRAVDVARPGDTIVVHPGTYKGKVVIRNSGTPGNVITLQPAVMLGDRNVTVTASLPRHRCDAKAPAFDRTISIVNGADHWLIRGLNIQGGILIFGSRSDEALKPYIRDRTLPGRGSYDPNGADATLGLLGSNAADHIWIMENSIRGRGIYASQARYAKIIGNEIYDIECATGGGIWLARYSDKAEIRNNHVHHIKVLPYTAHMVSEGIRLGSGSMYNIIEDNVVEDIQLKGRGIGADVNAGWNVFRRNYAARADHGLSEQAGGWGNKWLYNISEANRNFGFSVGINGSLADSLVPKFLVVQCNESRSDSVSLAIRTAVKSAFSKNKFKRVVLSSLLSTSWSKLGNTWDGSSKPPPQYPSAASFSTCSGS